MPAAEVQRRTSLKAAESKPSLKEQPSYLKEVGVALTRREELLKLKERLSSSRLILSADPSSKPWLLARQISASKLIEQPSRVWREREREDSSSDKDSI